MEIDKLLDNILDVPGIEGVCLFGIEGQVYVNRLPSFLTNELFADAQRRIVAMYETMDENFLPSDDYILRFSEHWLLLRRTDSHVLLVLGGDKANLSSTRMVTNMTIKRLTPAIMQALAAATPKLAVKPVPATAPPEAPTPLAAAPASVPMPAPVSPKLDEKPQAPVRMYRGRPY